MANLSMPTTTVFVRNATGLVRELSARDAFTLNMAVLNPGVGYIGIAATVSLFLNAQLAIPLVLAAITALFLALTYVQLVSAMPRTGGDFVFVSRILDYRIGAAIGGAILVLFFQFPGFNVATFASQVLPSGLSILAIGFNAPGLAKWGASFSDPGHAFIAGCVMLVVLGAIAIAGTKAINRFMLWAFVIAMAGFLIVAGLFLFNSQQDFERAFNAANPVTYAAVLGAASKAGYHSGFSWQATLGALPYMALLYWGFTWAVYPGGELKSASKTIRSSVLGALVMGTAMYLVIWLLIIKTIGWNFLNGIAFHFYITPKANPLSTPPLINLYAAYLSHNPVLDTIMAISFVAWSCLIVIAYFMVLSRIVFALSFDRILPTALADVNERTYSPVNAVILSILGVLGVFAISEFSSALLGVFSNSTLGLAIVYVFVSLAGMLLPYRKPDIYRASPPLFRGTLFGLPWVTFFGAGSLVFSVIIVALCIAQPSLYGAISPWSIFITVATFLWGVVALYISAAVNRRHGLDIHLGFQEIPPE